MDLRQLRYFVVLATQQHFGRASEVLRIAQPALSRQIKLLEEEFGVQLFERHSRGSSLTPEGALLLEGASHLLRTAEQLKSDIIGLKGAPRGTVVVGLSPALALLLTADLQAALSRAQPDLRMRIVEGLSPGLHDQMIHGAVDLSLMHDAESLPGLEAEPILEEDICIIGAGSDPALVRQAVAPISMLQGHPLILTGLPKSGIRLELELAAARAGLKLDVILEVESMTAAKGLVADGVGWTVHLAAPLACDLDQGLLRAVPLQGLKLTRSIAFAVGRPTSRAARAFADVLREVCRGLVRDGRWRNAREL